MWSLITAFFNNFTTEWAFVSGFTMSFLFKIIWANILKDQFWITFFKVYYNHCVLHFRVCSLFMCFVINVTNFDVMRYMHSWSIKIFLVCRAADMMHISFVSSSLLLYILHLKVMCLKRNKYHICVIFYLYVFYFLLLIPNYTLRN